MILFMTSENCGASGSGRNTNFAHLIRVCAACTVVVVFAFGGSAGSMDLFGSKMVRDVRYTKFSFTIANKSVGTVLDGGIRTLRNKHMLYLHLKLYERFTQFQGQFNIYKCKEYYVDCENVISYNITDGCSKINLFFHFMSIENLLRNVEKCPLQGEYSYQNFTVDVDKFAAMFSYPLEKWWERYWKAPVNAFGSRLVREIPYTKFNVTITNPSVFCPAGLRDSFANVFGSKLVREIRYTKFNVTTTNPSVGTVLDCGFRLVHNKHMLYLRYELTRTITEFHGEYSYSNFTVNAEEFGAMFSYPMERW